MDPGELKELRALLAPIFQKKSVERVVLFGSAARGTAGRKSDLDLLIVMKTRKRFF
jgi:predicted nucleotidyltransferase